MANPNCEGELTAKAGGVFAAKLVGVEFVANAVGGVFVANPVGGVGELAEGKDPVNDGVGLGDPAPNGVATAPVI